MPRRIQGITIEIDGNTTKLTQSLKNVDSQLKQTQTALRDIDKLLKLDPKNTELLTQKQKNLEWAIGDTETRLKELKDAQGKVAEGTDNWDKLQREIIATEQDLEKLNKQYKDFGSVTAQKIAAAGQKMEEFGGKVQKAGEAFTPISTAATGALAALGGLAYKTVSSADELATLAKQTGLTTDEIQKMKYASDLVDVSFEDISGALTKLKPKITEDNKALKDLGVEVKNADGSTRSATDVFYDTIAALSQIENETERDQKAMEIFGKGADSLAGIIDDGGAALKEYGKQAEDLGLIMSGDTIESLNDVNDTIDTLKAQGGATLAQLGATIAQVLGPSIKKLLGVLSKVSDAISKLTPEQATLILRILAATAAIAPLLKVGGKLISGVGKALKLAPKISTAIKTVGAAMSPTTLIIAAIVAAVVALGVIIYKNWDKIKAWTLDMVAKVKAAWENVKAAISNTVNNIKDTVVNVWTNIKTAVSTVVSAIKDFVTATWTNIKTSVSNVANGIKTAVTTAWTNIKTSVSNVVEGIKTAVTTAWTNIKTSVSTVVSSISDFVTTTWNNIKTSVSNVVNGIKTAVTTAWTDIKTSVTTTISNLKAAIAEKWENIKTTVSEKVSGIVTKVKSLFSFNFSLPSLKLPSWETIKQTLSDIVQKVKGLFDFDFKLPSLKLPTWAEIKTTLDDIVKKAKDAFDFNWSLPHIKLPHFRVQGGKWPYGLGGEGYLPSISIDWYRKAYENAMMFTRPTVMATPYGAKGFGDGTGAEIVLGFNKLRELVGASNDVVINVYAQPNMNVEQLANEIQRRFVAANKQRRVYA